MSLPLFNARQASQARPLFNNLKMSWNFFWMIHTFCDKSLEAPMNAIDLKNLKIAWKYQARFFKVKLYISRWVRHYKVFLILLKVNNPRTHFPTLDSSTRKREIKKSNFGIIFSSFYFLFSKVPCLRAAVNYFAAYCKNQTTKV